MSCTRANLRYCVLLALGRTCSRLTLMSSMNENSVAALVVNTYVCVISAVTLTCENEALSAVVESPRMCAMPMKNSILKPPSTVLSMPPYARTSSSAKKTMTSR